MDTKHNSRKAGQDEDIDVDHYFLPGGILDTPSQREEDMIGGSLLDEIGGVGNVAVSFVQLRPSFVVELSCTSFLLSWLPASDSDFSRCKKLKLIHTFRERNANVYFPLCVIGS